MLLAAATVLALSAVAIFTVTRRSVSRENKASPDEGVEQHEDGPPSRPVVQSRSWTLPIVLTSIVVGFLCIGLTNRRWIPGSEKSVPQGRFQCTHVSPSERKAMVGKANGIDHPVYTSVPEAQAHFDQGMLFRWGFNIPEAVKSFKIAHELDPSCAMCIWGRSYALTPHLNVLPGVPGARYPNFKDKDLKAARSFALEALRVAQENLRDSPQDEMRKKEVEYVHALLLSLPDDTMTHDAMFSAALVSSAKWMEIWESYLEDLDAGVLAAEGILTLFSWNAFNPKGEATSHEKLGDLTWKQVLDESASITREVNEKNVSLPADMAVDIGTFFTEFPLPEHMVSTRVGYPYMRMGPRIVEELLLRVLAINPSHPFAVHLHIHLTESAPPGDSEKGAIQSVRFSENLAALAPSSGHLLHMPSHTFFRAGMYKEAVQSNIDAYNLDILLGASCVSGYVPEHNLGVLVSAASMCGMYDAAAKYARLMNRIHKDLPGPYISRGDEYEALVFVWLRFGKWHEIQNHSPPDENSRGPSHYGGLQYTTLLWNFAQFLIASRENPKVMGRRLKDHSSLQNNLQERITGMEKMAGEIPATPRTVPGYGSGIYAAPYSEIGQILILLAKARLSFLKEDKAAAKTLLQEAVAGEDAMGYMEPRRLLIPMRHCLGWLLVLYEDWESAAEVFKEDLADIPKNSWSIFGLANTYNKWKGTDSPQAMEYQKTFKQTWKGAAGNMASSCPMLFD